MAVSWLPLIRVGFLFFLLAFVWAATLQPAIALSVDNPDGSLSASYHQGAGATPTVTATPTPPPEIEVAPTALNELHANAPQVTTQTLTIQNIGESDLLWAIAEQESHPVPALLSPPPTTAPAAPMIEIGSATLGMTARDFYASGALPPRNRGNVTLTLDDGSADTAIGFDNGGEFIWFNRFTPDPSEYPFILTEIIFATPGIGNCEVNEKVDFYLYQDPDSNPLNGATFIASLRNQTVGPFFTYTSYPVTVPFTGPGDVLILVVNRTCNGPFQYPAGLDAAPPSQQRSWLGYYDGTVADPPVLPAPQFFGLVDAIGYPGNWTLRGIGDLQAECTPPTDVPWLTVSPPRGTTLSSSASEITVTFDSTALADGVYTSTLCIVSNDPDESAIRLPVTLTVTSPTAIDLTTFSSAVPTLPVADMAAAGLLLLAGATVALRRK